MSLDWLRVESVRETTHLLRGGQTRLASAAARNFGTLLICLFVEGAIATQQLIGFTQYMGRIRTLQKY